YPDTWIAGDGAAAAMWIPPGGTELTEEDEALMPALLDDLCGARAGEVHELLDRFDASHPTDVPPHYYLSLLGTHPDHRGRGIGLGLLAHCLARYDEAGIPPYLESSNPVNTPRYERLGYRQIGSFTTPDDRHTVGTLWRDVPGTT